MPDKDSNSLTAKNAMEAKEGAEKLYRGGRQEEIAIFNPKSTKTTPSEVMAAPGWYTSTLQRQADAVADMVIPYLALSLRSSLGVDLIVVLLAAIAPSAVRLFSSSAGVAALAVRL